jgi:hypothetical protein
MLLSVKRSSVPEDHGAVSIYNERVFIQCTECGYQHGGKSVAPANFVKSHFNQHSTHKIRY